MIIEKSGKYYEVLERKNYWSATLKKDALILEFKVEKDICQTEEEIKSYILQEKMF